MGFLKKVEERGFGYSEQAVKDGVAMLRARGYSNEANAISMLLERQKQMTRAIEIYDDVVSRVRERLSTAVPRETILNDVTKINSELEKKLEKLLSGK